MKTLTRAFLSLVIVTAVFFSASCASNTADLPGQNKHSSMPQNLPQSWEGQGMLGGMAGYQ